MSSNELVVEDFPEFYDEVHGYEPFSWQVDLLHQVLETKTWPGLIDLPTGAGKTSVIDVAVFLLALNAAQSPEDLWAPRRIVMVVDRRIVVDQAHVHAESIARALTNVGDEHAERARGRVATALKSLAMMPGSAEPPPLMTGVLRGGLVLDRNWSLRPDTATVLSSTVDQVGSRLLFRGYGISTNAAPIHAGLIGNDSLIILDEVHLSRPFMETLSRVELHSPVRGGLARRTQTVLLSATPGHYQGSRFPSSSLDSADVEPELARRLRASKPVRLDSVKVGANPVRADKDFAKRVAAETVAEITADHVGLLGVVVNRVDTARRITELLERDRKIRRLDIRVSLVTGRMRPTDRDDLLDSRLERWSNRSIRGDSKEIIVATQSIEAGADLDLDGIVTECASIDALRQRFGRVDRRGDLTAAGTPPPGVVLLRGERPPESDPVYGTALHRTWRWLANQDPVDFGIEQLGDAPKDCTADRAGAPLLTRIHLRSFSRTAPRPTPDHAVSRWLHGDDAGVPDVSVLWRAELADLAVLLDQLKDDQLSRSDIEAELTARIGFCPPRSRETVEIPIHTAAAWLSGRSDEAPLISDTESMTRDPSTVRGGGRTIPWVVWRDQRVSIVDVTALRPGDTIIVPTTAGGIARRNWDPSSQVLVESSATRCAFEQARQLTCLIGPPPPATDDDERYDVGEDSDGSTFSGDGSDDPMFDEWTGLRNALDAEPDEPAETVIRRDFAESLIARTASELGIDVSWSKVRRSVTVVVTPGGFIGISCRIGESMTIPSGISGNADDASFTGVDDAYLDEHLHGVGTIAARFGHNLGLPDDLIDCLRLAGELHDLGKNDPRFQSWLVGGGPPPLRPLAKSNQSYLARTLSDKARQRSGYPRGARHELLSLRLAEAAEVLGRAPDPDLVAHLVVSHHGHGRPNVPAVVDPHPVGVDASIEVSDSSVSDSSSTTIVSNVSSDTRLASANSGIPRRFERLSERYGEHGLAWMEAIFRLADHRRSEWETQSSSGLKGSVAVPAQNGSEEDL